MALSAITQVVRERCAVDLGAFTLGGTIYLLWATTELGARRLWWRAHDGADSTEVALARLEQFTAVAAVGCADGASVLLVYTASPDAGAPIMGLRATVATGAVVTQPFQIATGSKPTLAAVTGTTFALVYREGQSGRLHLRLSYDGGLTWGTAKPLLNNKVVADEDLSLALFDATHLSIGQVGVCGQVLGEVGATDRSRPVTSLAWAGSWRLLVGEAAVRTGQVTDNLRGRMALDGAGNALVASRARQGTSDGVGDLARYDTFPGAPALLDSAVLAAGAAPGGEIVRAPIDPPGAGAVIATMTGSEVVADIQVFDGHGLFAGYAEAAGTGRAGWVDLATLVRGDFDLGVGVTRVGAITAARATAGGFDLLAVGYTAGGAEWLKLGAWSTPPSGIALSDAHVMPARVNSLCLTLLGSTNGRIYVGMADRVNVYAFDGVGQPIRLLRTHMLLTGGEVHQIVALDSENVVAALGAAGVAAFGPGGEILGHVLPSSLATTPWTPKTAYGLGALVRPTAQHPYAPQRRYFTCARAGTSGTNEPAWGPSGTTNDPNASGAGWTEVGSVEPLITGVAVDQDGGRVYAAGVLGGTTGTVGRIYHLDAGGFVGAPPRVPTPSFDVVEGSTATSITYVTITTGLAGATIYYTLDGTEPGLTAAVYDPNNRPLLDTSGAKTVRAVAVATGFRPSRIADLHFTIDLPNIPNVLMSPDEGVYFNQTVQVALTCAQIGVEIRYTTDGSDPTAASTLYTGPFDVSATATVKAKASAYGFDDSPTVTHLYTITRLLIPEVVGAVSHFYVANGAIQDRNGSRGWSEVGTVPREAAATVVAGKPEVEGVGPFSDANYFELAGSTDDAFDALINGDFTITFVLRSSTNPAVWFCNGLYNTDGFYFQHYSTYNCRVCFKATVYDANVNIADGGIHVITFGRKGSTWYWKVDKNATTQGAFSVTPTPATTRPARIGRYQNAGNSFGGTGRIFEGRFIATGPDNAAAVDALHAAIIP